MSEAITRLINDWVEAWNAHDEDRVAAIGSPDYEGVDIARATPERGPQGMRDSVRGYLAAFPDLQLSTEEVIVQGDRVAVVWTVRGTHLGPLMNIPPTGRRVEVRGVSVLTVEAGKIRRALRLWDVAGLLRAIGLLPEL